MQTQLNLKKQQPSGGGSRVFKSPRPGPSPRLERHLAASLERRGTWQQSWSTGSTADTPGVQK